MSKRILPILILIGTILLASCEGWTHPPTEISTPSWMWGDWVEPRLVDDDSSLDALYDEIIVSADDIMLRPASSQDISLAARVAEGEAYISVSDESDGVYRLELGIYNTQDRFIIECRPGSDDDHLVFGIGYRSQGSYEAEYSSSSLHE